MENNKIALEEKQQRDAKRFFFLWLRRLIVCYITAMAIYFVYVFAVQGVQISWVGDVQRNYAKFLVKQNDEFVNYMIEFEDLTSKTGSEYTEEEKALIKANLEKQNEFLSKLQKRSPSESNADYLDLYQDMLQIFAFYIQGEVMKAEYCYAYSDNYTLENQYSDNTAGMETYTMGQELCNLMGNMILNNFRYINEVRGTNYQSIHNIVEIGNTIPSGTTEQQTSTETDVEDEMKNIESKHVKEQ